MSDSVWPHRRQPTRLLHPWDSPGKNTGVGCISFSTGLCRYSVKSPMGGAPDWIWASSLKFLSEEKILRQCYSNFKNHLESMLCHRRICISVKLPDDTGAACPRSTLGDVVEAWHRTREALSWKRLSGCLTLSDLNGLDHFQSGKIGRQEKKTLISYLFSRILWLCALSRFSHVWLHATLWTVAC